jgi:TonB family protein
MVDIRRRTIATSFDLEFWKQLEGQSIDALFPLGRCLAGGPQSALFETEFQGRPAAIKLVPGTSDSLPARLASWERSKGLSHPALVAIFAHGETTLGDAPVAYLVMERTDDNLADLLTNRPLTPTETRDLLGPLLSVLQYLHANGFAHGDLQPASILASGDQLKVSSDSLISGGDPSLDSLAIGPLLREAMGANRGVRLPEPFAEIVRHTTGPDPAAQWDLPQIEASLRGERPPAPAAGSRIPWWAVAAAAVAILAVYIIWSARSAAPVPAAETPAPVPAAQPEPAAPLDASKPSAFPTPGGRRTAASSSAAPAPPAAPSVTPAGVTKVLPDIPDRARRTITGRVLVNVRVRVDSAGKVEKATLERPRSSKYLSARALAAAQAWKFPPGNPSQDWLIRFEIARQETLASAAKVGN